MFCFIGSDSRVWGRFLVFVFIMISLSIVFDSNGEESSIMGMNG